MAPLDTLANRIEQVPDKAQAALLLHELSHVSVLLYSRVSVPELEKLG